MKRPTDLRKRCACVLMQNWCPNQAIDQWWTTTSNPFSRKKHWSDLDGRHGTSDRKIWSRQAQYQGLHDNELPARVRALHERTSEATQSWKRGGESVGFLFRQRALPNCRAFSASMWHVANLDKVSWSGNDGGDDVDIDRSRFADRRVPRFLIDESPAHPLLSRTRMRLDMDTHKLPT